MGNRWSSGYGELPSTFQSRVNVADEEQLYCQNLSLFGKLFIDHKVSSYPTPMMQVHSSLKVCTDVLQSVFFHVSFFLDMMTDVRADFILEFRLRIFSFTSCVMPPPHTEINRWPFSAKRNSHSMITILLAS